MQARCRRGLPAIVLGLLAAIQVAADPGLLTGAGGAAAQTEPRPDLVGPEYDLFMATLERFTASARIAHAERRLSEVRAVHATFHRLAAEHGDSLARAVLGQSLSGLHPAAEMEQQVAQVLAAVDQLAALLEANREIREDSCPEFPTACALIADAQATADAIRVDEGQPGGRTANEQRFAALCAIASAQAGLGLVADAELSLSDALVVAPDTRDLQLAVAFARGLAMTGDWENARRSFAAAAELVDRRAGLTTVIDLNAIAAAQAAAGMTDAARASFDEALTIDNGLFRTMIVEAQVAAGLFAEARATAEGISSPQSRAGALSGLAAAQARAGATEDARNTLAEAEAAIAAIGDDAARGHPLSRLADARLALGLADDARATVAEALAVAARIADARVRLQVLSEIAAVQTAAGMADEADRTLADAASAARNLEDADWRSMILTRIGALQAAAGQAEDARRTFSDAIAAAALGDRSDHLFGAFQVAQAQAEAGQFDDALATAAALPEGANAQAAATLRAIAAAQADAGQFDDARATADRILAGPGDAGAAERDAYLHALAEIAEAQAAAAAAWAQE